MILHSSFDINSMGHLTIGDADALELAERFGTPLYAMDEDFIRGRCREYKKAASEHFGGASLPLYAGKAFSCRAIYRIMAEEGLGVDCVSQGELHTALSAGFPAGRVYLHGNNKTADELRLAVASRVGRIVVDNSDELDRLCEIARELGVKQDILLRITPGIDPHTHKKIITGNVDSKFGSAIATGAADEIVGDAMARDEVRLVGLHCHIGSQIFDIAPFVDATEIMTAYIARIGSKFGCEISELSLGGGFGVRYTESDPVFDYSGAIERLGAVIDSRCAELGIPKPAIMLEPGRSIVAGAGATLYTVGSVKTIPGFRSYVSVDGGMTDNPRYALYQSRYTVLAASRAGETADFECTVAGRCCESGDLIGENLFIQKPAAGDVLAVLVTGAYNYSMASNYNRVPRPPVVFIRDGEARTVVERESLDDLIRLDN